jgi:glycosyltransferase involved in cell wall biosynthesis
VKVALDAQLTVGTATGIGEYILGLEIALRRRGVSVTTLREPRLDPWRFDRRVLWDQLLLPLRARSSGAELLHCAAGTVPLFTRMPFVVTVHDVAWLVGQRHARPYARYYFGRFSLQRYRRAAFIAVDSAFSRKELLRFLDGIDPDRIVVVYPGVAEDYCTLARRAGDGRTILTVGTVEPRKNLEVLIRALPELGDSRLVAVGPRTPYAAHCAALAEKLGVAARVELRGYVSRESLLDLYANCAVAAVPSYYEGFGYALAQALCAGVPCIASDRSSLPEVAADDATIVAADDVQGWITALRFALNGANDGRAAQQRTAAIARFSWDAAAQRMKTIYDAAGTGRT